MASRIGETLTRHVLKWGATDIWIKRGGKHPRLVGTMDGKRFSYVFPGTSGDRRAELNCISDLRRMLGIVREEKLPHDGTQKSRLRRRRVKAKQIIAPVVAEPREDHFYAPLAELLKSFTSNKDAPVQHDKHVVWIALRAPFLGRRPRFVTL